MTSIKPTSTPIVIIAPKKADAKKKDERENPRLRVLRQNQAILDLFIQKIEVPMSSAEILTGLGWRQNSHNWQVLRNRLNAVRVLALSRGYALGYDPITRKWKMTESDWTLIMRNEITRIKTGATYFGSAGQYTDWLVDNAPSPEKQEEAEAIRDLTNGVDGSVEKTLTFLDE